MPINENEYLKMKQAIHANIELMKEVTIEGRMEGMKKELEAIKEAMRPVSEGGRNMSSSCEYLFASAILLLMEAMEGEVV